MRARERLPGFRTRLVGNPLSVRLRVRILKWVIKLLKLLPLLLAVPLHSQVVEISAGTSTLFEATGASATLHFANSESYLGLGVAGGHLHEGFDEKFGFDGWDVTAGDSFLGFTAAGSGLSIPTRGVSFSRHPDPACSHVPAGRRSRILDALTPCASTKITLFAGGTGAAYQDPFFSAATITHLSAGVFWNRQFRAFTLSTLDVLAGNSHTALGGLGAHWHGFKLSAGGGLLQSAPYWNADASYQPSRHLMFDGAHSTYIFAGETTSVNSLSAAAMASVLDFHASYLLGRGADYGAGARLGWLSFRIETANFAQQRNTFGTVSERIGRHFQVSEYISRSPSAGIEYASNAFSAGWSYQEVFFPFGAGFQRTLAAHVSFRIHDSVISLSGLQPPVGKALYSIGGQDYFGGPFQLAEQSRHAGSGKYLVRGIVLDAAGQPVAGAAIGVGDQIVYSDDAGSWQARFSRARPTIVRLLPEEFSAPGDWKAVTPPQSVIPAPEAQAAPVTLQVGR